MTQVSKEVREQVAGLVARARKAAREIEGYGQEQVDTLVKAITREIVREENSRTIAGMAVEESQLGNFEGKYAKLQKKTRGALRDMLHEKSVGVIEVDRDKGIIKLAKPVGVIGAIIPTTNPEATPVVKAISAIKGRNAIILAPHPRSKNTNTYIVNMMRDVLKKYGAPVDLIIGIEQPTMEASSELMRQCDLVVATGGAGLVKAAYSSGTPAYGVGAGNAVIVVDETADIEDAAHKIMLSKTFDYATSCSADNSVVVVGSVYERLLEALQAEGGYLADAGEKEKLKKALWEDGHLNREVIAQPAGRIAGAAGIEIGDGKSFIMVEETGVGPGYPFSGEKMSVVLTVYRAEDFDAAVARVNEITAYQGTGHSCGLFTSREDRVIELGMKTKVSRIMIRQPQCYGNTGNWDNGMPFTMTLGCGSWGGNIVSENITWRHLINVTWISMPIEPVIPSDEELFEGVL